MNRRRRVRRLFFLAGEAGLALALADVAHRFVKVAVRAFGGVADDAVDDELDESQAFGVGILALDKLGLKLAFEDAQFFARFV